MLEKKALSRSLALCIGLAGQILLIGCSRDNGVNPTGLSGDGVRGSQSLKELSPENRQRITTLMTKTAWAGEFHHQVLQEVFRRKPEWMGKDMQTRCRVGADVLSRNMPLLESRGQVARTFGERQQLVRDYARQSGRCSTYDLMNIFALRAPLTIAATADAGSDYNNLLYYSDNMVTRVLAANGDPGAVYVATQNVLANASWLPDVILEYLAAQANVAVSSAYEWDAYYSEGGAGYGSGDVEIQEPMSVFRLGWFWPWRRAARIGGVDVSAGAIAWRNGGSALAEFGPAAAETAVAIAVGFMAWSSAMAFLAT